MFNLTNTAFLLLSAAMAISASASPAPINPPVPRAPPAAEGAPHLQARYVLGGIDVGRACGAQNGVGWAAVRLGDGVGDWRCRRGEEWRSINMSAACAVQYGWPEAYAKWGNSAYDWTCHLDV